jgi:hypothetical protein
MSIDYASSRNLLQERANRLADDISRGSQGRYNMDNAHLADNQEGRWLAADRERLRQLDQLESAGNDPAWGQQVEREASTWETNQNVQAADANRRTVGQGRAALAARGLSGSGDEVAMQTRAQVQMEQARQRASMGARELRDAGLGELEELQRQLLGEILAENAGEAYGVGMEGQEAQGRIDAMGAGADADYRNLLANGIAGFVQNGVQPLVEGGFDRQSVLNDRLLSRYTEDLENWRAGSGDRPQRPALVSGWMDAWRRD